MCVFDDLSNCARETVPGMGLYIGPWFQVDGPVPNKPTVSVDVKQHFNGRRCSIRKRSSLTRRVRAHRGKTKNEVSEEDRR